MLSTGASGEIQAHSGGHGVNIPNIESMIDHDFICRGEGVHYLRELFKGNSAHVPKGTTANDPLFSEVQFAMSALFLPRFSISSAKRSRRRGQGD